MAIRQSYPKEPGVYLMKNGKGDIIYIGKANNLHTRIQKYFSKGGDGRAIIPFLLAEVASIDTILVNNETEALLLENTLIKKHQPKYNALLKDDKTFTGLFIDRAEKWPALRVVRYKSSPPKGGLYFGPYPHGSAAKETLKLLQRLFPLRQCSDLEFHRRTRPCILYSMKRCIAPCVNKCSKKEYDIFVEGVIRFLQGEDREIVTALKKEMHQAAHHLEFEKAAALLKTISQIESTIGKKQLVVKKTVKDIDVLSVYREKNTAVLAKLLWRSGKMVGMESYTFSNVAEEDADLLSSFVLQHYLTIEKKPQEILLSHAKKLHSLEEALFELIGKKIPLLCPKQGEKKKLIELSVKNAKSLLHQKDLERPKEEKLLLDLVELCHLTRYPSLIECYDTSNTSGKKPVAAVASFKDGKKDFKRMKLFHIKEAQGGDDYGALKEVLRRRLLRAKESDDLPDLIMVDGGKGHLHVAMDVLRDLDIISIDLLGIAKEHARHDKGLSEERVFIPGKSDPLILPKTSPLLFLLQKIRDEAHRIAIGFHRKASSKETFQSVLDSIPGIGKEKKRKLLQIFHSPERIFQATEEELLNVPSITKKDSRAIRSWEQMLRVKQNTSL